jgi:predicted DNA-binding transcriptional regulator AlpA
MANATQPDKGMILNSWKEIAQYLGRGVRTVQRYEQDLDLPVRRPRGKSRSSVIAVREELDEWLRRAPCKEATSRPARPAAMTSSGIAQAVQQAKDLRVRTIQLRSDHNKALELFAKNFRAMIESLSSGRRGSAS